MNPWLKSKIPNVWRHRVSERYYVRVRVGGGRERWKSLGTLVESVARLKAPRVLAQLLAEAGRLASADLSFGECAEVYLDQKAGDDLKARSLAYRRETVEMLRRTWPEFDGVLVKSVRPAELSAWASRARRRYSPTRFNGMVESLRGIFEVARAAGCVEVNLALEVERAAVRVKSRELPGPAEFAKLLAWLDRFKWHRHARIAIRALAFTGLRPNEAGNLSAADVRLPEKLLMARTTKNGDARMVQLIPQAVALFEAEGVETVVRALKTSPRKALRSGCKALGLPALTPYDLRHLNLTRLLECGWSVAETAKQAGHKDRGVTLLRTYVHVADEALSKKAELVKV